DAQGECAIQPNKTWYQCGSSCQVLLSCDNLPIPTGPQACTLECNTGCFCRPEFVIKGDGCVFPSDC
ncbi:Uncharacterised protein g11186, partial [Pycnogonum litorale]